MFKKLVQSRNSEAPPDSEAEPKAIPAPQREPEESPAQPENEPAPQSAPAPPELKKRGRPATGKRSDPDWIGRTYYIRKTTDLNVSEELLELKRTGINIDKSDLVDGLLDAWVKWRKGENAESQLGEISPRRQGENVES